MIETGHYTQVVGRDTKGLGCAVGKNILDGASYPVVVCNYYKPGNVENEFEANV